MAATLALADAAATAHLGARLARLLEPGDVVALEGDLGAGKSTLARACLQTLAGAPITVPSPTFTLVQSYEFALLQVWHVDLYRLGEPNEIDELGLEDAREAAALLIEWPERLAPDQLPDRLTIRLDDADGGRSRIARLSADASWSARLPRLVAADRGEDGG